MDTIESLTADKKRLLSIIDDMDTAIAVLYIGRDHGITPQADACMRAVCIRVRDELSAKRTLYAKEWAEARPSWQRDGKALPVETHNEPGHAHR